MKKAIYAGVAATLALAAPGIAQQTGQSDAVGDQTTIAVKLASQTHATGNATFTKTKDGIDVKVTTQAAPAGTEVAEIRKGSCASRRLGLNTKMSADSGMASSGGGVSTMSDTNSSSAGGSSKMTASTGGAATTAGASGAANSVYAIGKLTAAQGDQGQPIGAAETTLKNVTLTQLVSGNYAVAIVAPGGSNAGALCGDLNNALAPTTPATVNKTQ